MITNIDVKERNPFFSILFQIFAKTVMRSEPTFTIRFRWKSSTNNTNTANNLSIWVTNLIILQNGRRSQRHNGRKTNRQNRGNRRRGRIRRKERRSRRRRGRRRTSNKDGIRETRSKRFGALFLSSKKTEKTKKKCGMKKKNFPPKFFRSFFFPRCFQSATPGDLIRLTVSVQRYVSGPSLFHLCN